MAKSSSRVTVSIRVPKDVKTWIDRQVDWGCFDDAGQCVSALVRERKSLPSLSNYRSLNEMLAKAVKSGPPRPMTAKDWAKIRRAAVEGAAQRQEDDRARRRSA